MSVLQRLPALATTGVGSLPFDGPDAAVRHATRAYGVPFCPQLPRFDGDMVREWLGAEWSHTPCGWTSERDRERPAAWDAFVSAVSADPPEHRVVKLQATGPVTLAVAMERAAGRSGRGPDVVALAHDLARWLATNVAGQVAALRALDLDVLLVVDEPGLAHVVGPPRPAGAPGPDGATEPGVAVPPSRGTAPVDAAVWDPLRTAATAWGLHVCSDVPWALVGAAGPDVVSFDATRYTVGGAGAAVLAEIVDRGGRVAWGALDPVAPDAESDVAARVAAGVGAISAAGTSIEDVLAHSLVTPSCGTGRLSPARERLVASVVDEGAATIAATWRSWPRVAPIVRGR